LPGSERRIGAVILNWRGADQSARCVEALLATCGGETDFLIVENGSGDDSGARLRALFGAERVLERDENGGYAGGMSAGIAAALERWQSDHLLLLTQDVTVEPGAVQALVDALDGAPDTGIAGPVVVFADDPARVFSAGKRLEPARARALPVSLTGSTPYDVDSVDGCCILLRRRVAERVGAFDARFFMYYEETDYCRRARAAGWRVQVVPAARVRQERPELPAPHYYHYMSRNAFLFWREGYGVRPARVAWSLGQETMRTIGTLALSLVGQRRLVSPRVAARHALLQLRGVLLGVRDHARGRYGARHQD
jgi:GT2 family glycosyltransferase